MEGERQDGDIGLPVLRGEADKDFLGKEKGNFQAQVLDVLGEENDFFSAVEREIRKETGIDFLTVFRDPQTGRIKLTGRCRDFYTRQKAVHTAKKFFGDDFDNMITVI